MFGHPTPSSEPSQQLSDQSNKTSRFWQLIKASSSVVYRFMIYDIIFYNYYVFLCLWEVNELKKRHSRILLKFPIRSPNIMVHTSQIMKRSISKFLEQTNIPRITPYINWCNINEFRCNYQEWVQGNRYIPLQPEVVLRKFPEYKENREPQTTIDETFLNFLKDSRSPSTSNTTKGRNKKICTRPGESVSTNDFRLNSNNRVWEINEDLEANVNSVIFPGTIAPV